MPELTENSSSVQAHLGILQRVIERMASNSTMMKSWCVTVVSAILVIVADKNRSDLCILAYLPIVMFLFLDTYYLSMEKGFRESYNEFIKKLHDSKLQVSDLYLVRPAGNLCHLQVEAFFSLSVWGFYLPFAMITLFAKLYLVG